MKKFLIFLSIPGIILAESIEEEIINKIDVKKEIEERLELSTLYAHSPSIPPYLAYRNMKIYHTCSFLDFALLPYFYKFIKKFKVENEKEILNYENLFYQLINSTHILIGEVVKVEDGVIYYNGNCHSYCKKGLIRPIKVYKGKIEKNIISVWVLSCEGKVWSSPIYQELFIKDTILFFLENLPQNCDAYVIEHGENINYFPGDFFPTLLISGVNLITEIDGEKMILSDFKLPYENVIEILNTFVPICEKLEKKARKYKFPLKDEEYVEFMKKRGYHNYPSLSEEEAKISAKRFEEKLKEIENERKKIFGF